MYSQIVQGIFLFPVQYTYTVQTPYIYKLPMQVILWS